MNAYDQQQRIRLNHEQHDLEHRLSMSRTNELLAQQQAQINDLRTNIATHNIQTMPTFANQPPLSNLNHNGVLTSGYKLPDPMVVQQPIVSPTNSGHHQRAISVHDFPDSLPIDDIEKYSTAQGLYYLFVFSQSVFINLCHRYNRTNCCQPNLLLRGHQK